MKKPILMFAIFTLFIYLSSENADAVWTGLGCVPAADCNAVTYTQYDASCTDFRTLAACHTSYFDCQYQFKDKGAWCPTGTCCAGKCGANPVTEPLCQTPKCASGGWTAENKPDTDNCLIMNGGMPGNCKNGAWRKCDCYCGTTRCDNCIPTSVTAEKCTNQGGVGVPFPNHPDCVKSQCAKYSVFTGIATGGGLNRYIPEICFDDYDPATKNYTQFIVDAYVAGRQISETKCEAGHCASQKITCVSTENTLRKGVDPGKGVMPTNVYPRYLLYL